VTNSEVSNDLPDKPTSDNEQPDKATCDKEQPGKPPSSRNLKSRLRARLQLIGGALASIAAVGAIAGGLVGYWNVWKTLRTDVFPESQKTQREATARPDIVPRLSLVVLPFANLNNDPEQDYFADAIATDLTTDLAQMPGAFVIGRGTAFTYKNKQVDLKTLGKELGIRWAVQGAVRRNGDHVRVNVSLTDLPNGRDVWSDPADIFASIANYLKGHGWQADHDWGREVKVTRDAARRIAGGVARRTGGCRATRDMTVALPPARWQELGVRLPSGKALPASMPAASLVSGDIRHFLVYPNYDAILDYNCANSYAISVALLGNAVISAEPSKTLAQRTPKKRKK